MSVALYFVAGLLLLLIGAHLLVSSSSTLAARIGIPAILIGVTVVAFATSAPEVAVSLSASLNNQADLALGNVIGSNIANILFIIGASALITPVEIKRRIIRLDIPIMILASVIVYMLAFDSRLGSLDGVILLILFVAFMVFQVAYTKRRSGIKNSKTINEDADQPFFKQAVFFVAGLALLILGADWMVESSISIARMLGISELIIGLTIIALGTSLPEVATSAIAAWKNEPDISVGNVIGSNIFNLFLVLGLAAVISDGGISVSKAALALDLPFLIAVSVACLPIFFTGHKIARWEGIVFLGYYASYILYLFLESSQHNLLEIFNTVMIYFVVPITILTLGIFVFRYLRVLNKQSKT